MLENEFNHHNDTCKYSFRSKNFPSQSRKLSSFISHHINDGIYKCLLAQTISEKRISERKFFKAITKLNSLLRDQQYLIGTIPTESDWRFFVTLIRFELIYSNLFFQTKHSLDAFENIQTYLAKLFKYKKISTTINLHEMVRGYYGTLGIKEEIPDVDSFVKSLKQSPK